MTDPYRNSIDGARLQVKRLRQELERVATTSAIEQQILELRRQHAEIESRWAPTAGERDADGKGLIAFWVTGLALMALSLALAWDPRAEFTVWRGSELFYFIGAGLAFLSTCTLAFAWWRRRQGDARNRNLARAAEVNAAIEVLQKDIERAARANARGGDEPEVDSLEAAQRLIEELDSKLQALCLEKRK